jgi:Glycogen debranching enzyme
MSYLKFDKTIMINLEESLSREMLRTNRQGAYHCTTFVDCNTRKYHGLLVMPVPALGEDNHVILSSFDETVIQHGAEFNLGIHKYSGDNFSPKGHKYIREFSSESTPRTLYRVGGVIFSKEKVFSTFENRIMIKYTLEDAHSATTLRFRPFMAFRNVNDLTNENNAVNKTYSEIQNGIKTCMYHGYPELHMQFSKKAKFVFEPYWYKGLEYPKEQERGYPFQEDLYVPGYFEVPIRKGESIYFSAGDTPVSTTKLKNLFNLEVESRTPRTSFYNCLKNSAQQLYYRPTENDAYLLAGYPWFGVRARDMFVSLPGCTLSIDDPVRFEKIMDTAIPPLLSFMKKGTLDSIIKEIEQPDILLWAVWAIQQYAKHVGIKGATEKYGSFVTEAVNYIVGQKHPDMKVAENGLLFANGKEKAITWMNSTSKGTPVVKRSGYIVEFNALWYNMLCFHKEINESKPDAKVEKLITSIDQSFPEVFINGYNYLFDSVSGSVVDWSVRPNMIFAVALPYSPLSRLQKRAVLDFVTKKKKLSAQRAKVI